MNRPNPYELLLNDENLPLADVERRFLSSWDGEKISVDKDLFLEMYAHCSITALTRVTLDQINDFIDNDGLSENFFTHWINANEEMQVMVNEELNSISSAIAN